MRQAILALAVFSVCAGCEKDCDKDAQSSASSVSVEQVATGTLQEDVAQLGFIKVT